MTRTYGMGRTHLKLTSKAEHCYSSTDPLTIIEHESYDADEEPIYTYSIKEPEWNMLNPVSEDELNEWLEAMDDIYTEEGETMKKSFPYRDAAIEITSIRFIYADEKQVQDGILLHYTSDEFHDGDTIFCNGWTINMVNDTDDLETLLTSGDGTTYFTELNPGLYHVEA